jgi:cellulose synthase operon protein C
VLAQRTRLDELRRRVEKDPASIAFASLAEELRRTGDHDEAVRVCRAGLEHHPTYLSARVTLGRALLELQQYPEARTELEYVIHAAPDNLIALKCMSELQERAGDGAPAEPAQALGAEVQASPDIQPASEPPAKSLAFAAPPVPVPADGPAPEPAAAPAPPPPDPALRELERWQAGIQSERAKRAL